MKITVLIVFSTLFLAATLALAGSHVNLGDQIKITTTDSLELTGYLRTGKDTSSHMIIAMLPMMGHTTQSFEPLIAALEKACPDSTCLPKILTMDLRGHGESIQRGKKTLNFQELPQSEFAKYPNDVRQMLDSTVRRAGSSGSSAITVVGASIGANTAALLTEKMSSIARIVLLSPGKDFHGLQPAEAIKKFKGKILLVASKGDTNSLEAVKYFHELNPEHSELLIFEGDAHATDLLDANPQAMKAVVDWLLKK